jgi:glycosyltransferase involved in cell wall biosynthesis
MTEKIKLLTISDMPLVNSGVAIQTRYIIQGLLATGKYKIVSLGAAISHKDQRPIRVSEYGDDWTVLPVSGYGDPNLIRHFLMNEGVDAIWIMTDPRFYTYLFEMSDEIRGRNIPLLYNHVWDNYPVPDYNKSYYESCDFIGCISKLTHDIVKTLVGEEKCQYIPHAVEYDVFKQFSQEEINKLRAEKLGENKDKFLFFYNSRNARRKMTSDIIKQYEMFLRVIGKDKALFLLNTNPHDQEGGNLDALAKMLGLTNQQVMFTGGGVQTNELVNLYNMADVTVNLSNAEGFGLSSLESLACGTPVISTKTGGLQDQNLDTETGEVFGVSIKPATKSIVGSQEIPYIYEDRVSDQDAINAFLKMYHMKQSDRYDLGTRAREFVMRNFDLQFVRDQWDLQIVKQIQRAKNRTKKVSLEVV